MWPELRYLAASASLLAAGCAKADPRCNENQLSRNAGFAPRSLSSKRACHVPECARREVSVALIVPFAPQCARVESSSRSASRPSRRPPGSSKAGSSPSPRSCRSATGPCPRHCSGWCARSPSRSLPPAYRPATAAAAISAARTPLCLRAAICGAPPSGCRFPAFLNGTPTLQRRPAGKSLQKIYQFDSPYAWTPTT